MSARTRYGDHRGCALCGFDIEFQGRPRGWVDRGGVRFCDESGAARWDADGVPIPFPHVLHKPARS